MTKRPERRILAVWPDRAVLRIIRRMGAGQTSSDRPVGGQPGQPGQRSAAVKGATDERSDPLTGRCRDRRSHRGSVASSCIGAGGGLFCMAGSWGSERTGIWAPMSARQRAQDTIEYGILIATIAIVVLVGINAFGYLLQPWLIALAQRITTNS